MNSWYQRQLVYLQHLKSKQITQDNRLPINHLIGFSPSRFGLSWLSLFGLFVAMGIIIEPIVSGDRTAAFADENCVKPSSLQNFLNRVTLGEDHLTRYAATANQPYAQTLQDAKATENAAFSSEKMNYKLMTQASRT
jgi:hypothetical protein